MANLFLNKFVKREEVFALKWKKVGFVFVFHLLEKQSLFAVSTLERSF